MKRERCHFWLGKFETEDSYFNFIGEDSDVYEQEDDETPVSKFSESQGETWLDHDFIESGYEAPTGDLKKQFGMYSYADKWADELEKRASTLDKNEINTLVFINADQIENPVSIREDDLYLEYMGTIEYEI